MLRSAQPYRVGLKPVHRRHSRPVQTHRLAQRRWFPTFVPTATTVARVSLSAGATPQTRTLHSIVARAKKASGTGVVNLWVALYEGGTNRSGDIQSAPLTTALADYELAIDDGAAATIGSYSNLEVRFWATSSTGDVIDVDVADIYLQIPAEEGVFKTHRFVPRQAVNRASRW